MLQSLVLPKAFLERFFLEELVNRGNFELTFFKFKKKMVSALDSESSGLGSSPDRQHGVVFLGETLYSHSASLSPPRCINGYRRT